MRGAKVLPQPKKDVETLSDEALFELKALKENAGFTMLDGLMKDFLARRVEEVMTTIEGRPFEQIGVFMHSVSQMKVALDYFLDTPTRAEEELKRRHDEKSE